MELADLVRAVTRSRLSLALRFLLLGALAFGAKRALVGGAAPRIPLLVEVPAAASQAEIDRATEDAMLLDVAERARLPQADAVVRERLVRSLAVVEDVSDGNAAVLRAIALGLHRQDVVARERLLADARELLFAERPAAAPTDEAAHQFLRDNPDEYATPARVQFEQVFLSRERRGSALRRDAARLAEQLALGDAIAGDAWAWTSPSGQYSEARLDALAGPGFGRQVMNAKEGAWSGPLESSFGLHFVYVTARTAAAPPTVAALSRARADLAERERARARDQRLRALRTKYDVAWVRTQ